MMKGQKGITLVALVITIIVMLILAGVTISIILNGGLFQQATEASDQTSNATVDDAITSALGEVIAIHYGTARYADSAAAGEAFAAAVAKSAEAGTVSTTVGTGTVTVTATKTDHKKVVTITVTGSELTITPASGNADGLINGWSKT